MGLEWNLWGMLRLVTCVAGASLAAYVFQARPHRAANRWIALTLLVEGMAFGGAGLLLSTDDPTTAYAGIVTYMALAPASFILYLGLVGTLETPLAAPLRRRGAAAILVGAGVLAAALVLRDPSPWAVTVYPVWFAHWEVLFGPGYLHLLQASMVVHGFGLVAALDAWRRAPHGSARRSRARAFAVAFGTRDTLFVLFVAWVLVRIRTTALGDAPVLDVVHLTAWPLISLVFFGLLAYGILREQLFDIQVRVKAGIDRSVVAAVFAFAFIVGGELLEGVLPVDGVLGGVLAAALVALVHRPLRRLIQRTTDAALPDVDAPDTLARRRLEVYRAAAEGAAADGAVSDRERAVLDALGHELGIGRGTARRIEREAAAAVAP